MTLKEIGFDATVGIGSYLVILKLDWLTESQHVITGLVTAIVCVVGVHFMKKLLALFDKTKQDDENRKS